MKCDQILLICAFMKG